MKISLLQDKFRSLFEPAVLTPQADEWKWRIPKNLREVYTLGYATSLTPEVIQAAVDCQVQLIITHHDAWDFLHELRVESLNLLEQYGIAHLFVHAPLDFADFGTSATLLKRIGCTETGRFDCEGEFYWGRYGEQPVPVPFDAFVDQVSGVLGEAARIAQPGSGMVRKIGVVTGGGCSTDELAEASRLGCDTYLTGESTSYFLMYGHYLNLNLLVHSHTATEIPGVEVLAGKLVEDHPAVRIIRLPEALL